MFNWCCVVFCVLISLVPSSGESKLLLFDDFDGKKENAFEGVIVSFNLGLQPRQLADTRTFGSPDHILGRQYLQTLPPRPRLPLR